MVSCIRIRQLHFDSKFNACSAKSQWQHASLESRGQDMIGAGQQQQGEQEARYMIDAQEEDDHEIRDQIPRFQDLPHRYLRCRETV